MKARNREINIFNMSLLDILCGALGAFCFLMLVLLPYYAVSKGKSNAPDVPPGVDPKTYDEAVARIKQLEETIDKFKKYTKDLENQVDQAKQTQKNTDEQVNSLEVRNPFVTYISVSNPGDGDEHQIYIYDTRTGTEGTKKIKTPEPDLSKYQTNLWEGDLTMYSPRAAYWMVRDGVPGEYQVMWKLMKHDVSKGPLYVRALIHTAEPKFVPAPLIAVNKAQVVVPIGTVKITRDKDGKYQQIATFNIPPEYIVKEEDNKGK